MVIILLMQANSLKCYPVFQSVYTSIKRMLVSQTHNHLPALLLEASLLWPEQRSEREQQPCVTALSSGRIYDKHMILLH